MNGTHQNPQLQPKSEGITVDFSQIPQLIFFHLKNLTCKYPKPLEVFTLLVLLQDFLQKSEAYILVSAVDLHED